MISIMILAFMMEILTLAPQYATFGTQTYKNGNSILECTLTSTTTEQGKDCIMSNISTFYNKISLSLPFFSTIFFFSNWFLIMMILSSLIYTGFYQEEDVIV